MTYNSENKITLEELSPSLQNLLTTAATKSEVTSLNNRADALLALLSKVKFSIVDSLDEITLPVNGKNLAVSKYNDGYRLYMYFNDRWNYIPTASINLNKQYLIKIEQKDHQRITVECGGIFYTSSFYAKVNSEINVAITSDTGYYHGDLNCPEMFNVIGETTISATPAKVIPNYKITVQPADHQTIEIQYKGRTYINQSVTGIPENDTYSLITTIDYGWNAGELIVSPESTLMYNNIYAITGDTTISLYPAYRKTFNVFIPATEHQSIILEYVNSETEETHSIIVTDTSFSIDLPFGSTFTVSAKGIMGYLPGTLSTTGGTLTNDITITISSAQKTYNKEVYDDAGSYHWRSPSYISKVHLEIAGAGGGAHSEVVEEGSQSIGYFNGGNGDLIDIVVSVQPNTVYDLVVGSPGISFETDGEPSSAFGVISYGGLVDGSDAGNGRGGKGDSVQYLTGHILIPAQPGWMSLEYGTRIEEG